MFTIYLLNKESLCILFSSIFSLILPLQTAYNFYLVSIEFNLKFTKLHT